ncbi:unnamed protein product [Rotaria sp. Silwood1]|nr:unnamed protein product [Rotaria sp. Silwood1]
MNIIDTERPVQGQARLPRVTPTNNATSITQQNSNINNFVEPSPESDSYANDDTLKAIREISEKKMKEEKNKKTGTTCKKSAPTSENETEEEKDDDTVTNESSNEEQSNEEKRERQKKIKKQAASNPSASCTIDPEQFKTLTIHELLDRYSICTDQRMSNFIVYELMQRSIGKSVGPLKSPESLVEFTASSQKYCALGPNALRQQYQRLKSHIATITEPDILKIGQVPLALLLEIAAVHILLQRAPPDDEPKRYNFNHSSQSSYPTVNSPNDHTRFTNRPQNDHFNASMPFQSKPAFNPQPQQSSYPCSSSQRPQQHPYKYDEQQNDSIYTNEPPPYDNQNDYPHYYPDEQQQQTNRFVHNRSTFPPSTSTTNIQKTFDSMHLSADHRDHIPSSNDHHLSSTANELVSMKCSKGENRPEAAYK